MESESDDEGNLNKLNIKYYDHNKICFVEPNTLHVVNTFIEMPEGASLSDNEDKNNTDANDPHRALDIDLDM